MRYRLLLVLLGLTLTASVLAQKPVAPKNPDDAQKKLEVLRGQIKELTREQQALDDKRSDAAKVLREIDGEVAGSAGALRKLDAAIIQRQSRLEQLRIEQQAKQASVLAQRADLAGLLRSSYALGNGGSLKWLLAQDRPDELARMQAYHRYFEVDRQRRITRINSELTALVALAAQIETEQADLQAERTQRHNALAALQARRSERGQVVQGLEARLQDRQARIKAMGRDEQVLQSLLEKLRTAIARAPAVAPIRPRVPDPAIKPSVARAITGLPLPGTLLAGFGQVLPDGRRSDGLLIAANAGDTVRAVAAGRVVFADWLKGYGLLVIIDHGEGWMSLYAYNDALLKNAGDSIQAGEAVAAVGNSGGQGRPALYFEMRRNGQPQNPGAWLKP